MVLKTCKINLYLPLRTGGPRVWGNQLAKNLLNSDFQVNCYSSLAGYFSEPFSFPITHSTIPFPHPIRGKYLLTIHGDYSKEPGIWSKLYPLAINQADIITVPSKFLREELGLDNAIVIPNGIHVQPICHTPSKQIKTIGTMTNFNFKGKADGILSLAEVLKSLDSKIALLVAGDGIHLNEYQEKVLAIYPNSKFIGYVDPAKFFRSIDIYAHYSFLDNQPISLLQAMSYGLPVVSNKVGSIPEILSEDLGKFIAKNDPEYKTILIDLLGTKRMQEENSELSFEKAQEYDWDKVAKLWTSLYTSLLD